MRITTPSLDNMNSMCKKNIYKINEGALHMYNSIYLLWKMYKCNEGNRFEIIVVHTPCQFKWNKLVIQVNIDVKLVYISGLLFCEPKIDVGGW